MRKLLVSIALAMIAFTSGPAAAQTTGNGPYYANPSWDQQLPAAQRFIMLSNWNNEAVLDRETGLVWQRTPLAPDASALLASDQPSAVLACSAFPTGGRSGWRLPALEEMQSLTDPTQSNPALPPGHPFLQVFNGTFWTASTLGGLGIVYGVGHSAGGGTLDPTTKLGIWCVRGGSRNSAPVQ